MLIKALGQLSELQLHFSSMMMVSDWILEVLVYMAVSLFVTFCIEFRLLPGIDFKLAESSSCHFVSDASI
jgi:hypothetical protein